MACSFQSELLNYGKGAVTFIRGALIGARARAWLGLKRLWQMHPKTFTTGNSLLSHLVPLSQCNVRRVKLTRTRVRERERRKEKKEIVLLFPLHESVALCSTVLFLSTESCLPPHTCTHRRYTNVWNAQIDTRGGGLFGRQDR